MILFAGGSAAATVAWEKHGDTARQMLAEWTPALTALTSLLPSTSRTAAPVTAAPVTAAQAAPPADQPQRIKRRINLLNLRRRLRFRLQQPHLSQHSPIPRSRSNR